MQLEQKAITSIEVAEMVEKDHSDLLKDIRRYTSQLGEGKSPPPPISSQIAYIKASRTNPYHVT